MASTTRVVPLIRFADVDGPTLEPTDRFHGCGTSHPFLFFLFVTQIERSFAMGRNVDVRAAQQKVQDAVILTDILAGYILDRDFETEDRQRIMEYLIDKLGHQVIAVETALDAAPASGKHGDGIEQQAPRS